MSSAQFLKMKRKQIPILSDNNQTNECSVSRISFPYENPIIVDTHGHDDERNTKRKYVSKFCALNIEIFMIPQASIVRTLVRWCKKACPKENINVDKNILNLLIQSGPKGVEKCEKKLNNFPRVLQSSNSQI